MSTVWAHIQLCRFVAMSEYEERALLRRLQARADVNDPKSRRLVRKLIVRQLKRERHLPLLNLDSRVNDAISRKCQLYGRTSNSVGLVLKSYMRAQRAIICDVNSYMAMSRNCVFFHGSTV